MVFLGHDDGDPDPAPGLVAMSRTLAYERRGGSIIRREPSKNGRSKPILIANFTARIVGDLILDDGEEVRRSFVVEAKVGGRSVAFAMTAAEFSHMGWVLDKLGPQAIIYPGQRQHARAAIQFFSNAVEQERIFTHLGWRKQGAHWLYLHAAGALGTHGPLARLQVQVPAALHQFQLSAPADDGARAQAVRASLRLLSVSPDPISLPLLAAVYRAPFGNADFSLFLAGRTGVFKSANPQRPIVLASGALPAPTCVKSRYTRLARTSRSRTA
jgi:hypothetical protein